MQKKANKDGVQFNPNLQQVNCLSKSPRSTWIGAALFWQVLQIWRLARSKGAKGAIKQVSKQPAVFQTLVEQGANKKRLQINGSNPKRKCSREPSLNPPLVWRVSCEVAREGAECQQRLWTRRKKNACNSCVAEQAKQRATCRYPLSLIR